MASTRTSKQTPQLRHRPADSQRNLGGDMSMNFFVRCQTLRKFTSPEDHLIKGLNVETIVGIRFPTPAWMDDIEYSILQPDPATDDGPLGAFSLNLSVYNRSLLPSDWDDMWFFMHGRVHPYALTWEVRPDDGLDCDDAQEFTIPTLMVRDDSYQPVSIRSLDPMVELSVMPPIVSFAGPVVGSGAVLLHDDPISGLRDVQRKCCGFVQLSTFISPGNPTKTPYRGFHPFQVFVIFPIHVNPWTALCKKMVDRADTSFQPNTTFTCTGKVAGLLRHDVMVSPPPLAQDMVFIVVPDSWMFHDRTARSSTASSLPASSPPARTSTNPLDRSKFMTPSKRSAPAPAPASDSTGDQTSEAGTSTTLSSQFRLDRPDDTSTPSKKPRVMRSTADMSNSTHAPTSILAAPGKPTPYPSGAPHPVATVPSSITVQPLPAPPLVEYSVPPQASTSPPDDLNRPHRHRNPPKKFSTLE